MVQMIRALERHPFESFCLMLLVGVFLRRIGPQ